MEGGGITKSDSPIRFPNYNVCALGIEVNSVKNVASKLLNKRRVINFLLRCHDRQMKLERARSTCLCLIKWCSIKQIHGLWFQSVLDLKSKGWGSGCGAGDRRGGFGSDCRT